MNLTTKEAALVIEMQKWREQADELARWLRYIKTAVPLKDGDYKHIEEALTVYNEAVAEDDS